MRPGKYPCQKNLHTLKSTANKSSCNNFGDSKIQIPANTTKVMNIHVTNTRGFPFMCGCCLGSDLSQARKE